MRNITVGFLVRLPKVTTALLAANLFVFLLMSWQGVAFQWVTASATEILPWGANFNPLTLRNEWWRLFTSMFVHGGYLHILVNMYVLLALGSDLEKYVGSYSFGVVYFLCGIGAGLASLWWNLFTVSVGASGAIFGIYGFNLVVTIIEESRANRAIWLHIGNFGFFIGVNLLLGSYLNVDHAGHFGGLFTGILLAFYREIRTYTPWKFSAMLDGVWVFGLLFLGIFIGLPRSQTQYYWAFQDMLEKEKKSSAIIRGDYRTDAVYLDTLRSALPLWEETRNKVATIDDLPLELLSDQAVLVEYCSLRREGIAQRIKSLEKESYIYWDSIEVVNENVGALPGLRYILNYETVSEEISPPDTTPKLVLYPIKIYYDSNWQQTLFPEIASYYREGKQDSLGRWQGKVRDFYRDGSIQMKGYYKDDLKDGVFLYYRRDSTYEAAGVYNEEFKTGKWEYFHENGMLERKLFYDDRTYTLHVWDSVGNPMVIEGNGTEVQRYANGIIQTQGAYSEGLRTGLWYGYYENGAEHYEELYDRGRLVSGKSFDLRGNVYRYTFADAFPLPLKGEQYLQTYLDSYEFIYPDTATTIPVGEMTVFFTVDETGTLTDFRFKDAPNITYEWQAKQLLLEGPKWQPGKLFGKDPYKAETLVKIKYP